MEVRREVDGTYEIIQGPFEDGEGKETGEDGLKGKVKLGS